MNIIVAACPNNGIGYQGIIPWHLKKELAYFKKVTKDSTIIMGRKTFMSLPIKPLPGRVNIVLTKSSIVDMDNENIIISNSFDNAIEKAKEFKKKIFIIGGSDIYKEAITHPELEYIYFTAIKADFICDVFFPLIPRNFVNILKPNKQVENNIEYEFRVYKNINIL